MAATSSSVLSATDVSRDSFFLSRDKYLLVTEKIVNSISELFPINFQRARNAM